MGPPPQMVSVIAATPKTRKNGGGFEAGSEKHAKTEAGSRRALKTIKNLGGFEAGSYTPRIRP